MKKRYSGKQEIASKKKETPKQKTVLRF